MTQRSLQISLFSCIAMVGSFIPFSAYGAKPSPQCHQSRYECLENSAGKNCGYNYADACWAPPA